jgi:hypothetical protein
MSPDLLFALMLAIKMSVAAAFVVIASIITERAGPLIGAMVTTLPVSAGPAYVFLALDHPPAFIAASALTSLSVNAVTTSFALTYAIVAQRRSLAVSLPVSLGVWLLGASACERVEWTITSAMILNAVVFAVSIPLSHRYQHAKMPLVRRRWYDVPLRACMVGCLVAAVVGLSTRVGPAVTGVLAVYPMVLTSLILILQPRIGGPATGAVMAHTIWGLTGFAAALATLSATVVPLGAPAALVLALAVSVGANILIWLWRRRERVGHK